MGQKKSKFHESTDTLNVVHAIDSKASTINSSLDNSFYTNTNLLLKSHSYQESAISHDSGCFSDRQDCPTTTTDSLKSDKSVKLAFDFHEFRLISEAKKNKERNKKAAKLLKEINQILSKNLAHIYGRFSANDTQDTEEFDPKRSGLRRTLSEKNIKNSHSKIKRQRSASKIDDLRCKMTETLTRTLPLSVKRSNSKAKVYISNNKEGERMAEAQFDGTDLSHRSRYNSSIRRTHSRKTVCKRSSIRFDDDKYGIKRASGGTMVATNKTTAAEKLTNLIAAKLLAENIDLAREPYTDEMGFCKIPRALVKRYACELRKSIEEVGRCIENERLSQLKRYGRLGIPNDLHLTRPCLCTKSLVDSGSNNHQSIESRSGIWNVCACDVDTTSGCAEVFLYKLGLPMYADLLKKRAQPRGIDQLKYLQAMNRAADIEIKLKVKNKNHSYVIFAAVQTTRKMMAFSD